MLYIYEVETNKIVNVMTDEAFRASEYADWCEGNWNDAGLATTYTPALGCYDGLHY